MLPGCFYKNIAAFFFSKGQVNMVASTPGVDSTRNYWNKRGKFGFLVNNE